VPYERILGGNNLSILVIPMGFPPWLSPIGGLLEQVRALERRPKPG
jgi:hypothetical protein